MVATTLVEPNLRTGLTRAVPISCRIAAQAALSAACTSGDADAAGIPASQQLKEADALAFPHEC